ncbi:uncharacterized protein LOC115691813 isoform X1 [Syzygium oleosum]|uniref:uncharacterized protein LOC115691813 isoform X1 n=1 Tax=Syzygium oleosum TaxID=219896 RepID=UPI0024BB0303|nr:uncharacterized protein LOC115691813 isoform X1 [Syzygium oleosum]XP_056174029.1 uncharacterized protein LOC115691813 isoform X1 [Syzygium oleosum]
MGSEVETLEERLKSSLVQLHAEYAILERMVYKNKNQHRRCSYFQYLLKVRRDLRLLQSAKLEELLSSCFQVITGKKPKQKVHLLESLKWRKCDVGKPNFIEQLHGVARLLSQMVEPMLKAACEISILLARSFFMGFSMTILSLLARLRVLVQQILLDVASVFNIVSSISQKKQSVKLTHEGIEVFREFYPTHQDHIMLECVWKTDKFVLLESTYKNEGSNSDGDRANASPGAPAIHYRSIDCFLEDECDSVPQKAEMGQAVEQALLQVEEDGNGSTPNVSVPSGREKQGNVLSEEGHNATTARTPENKFSVDGGFLDGPSLSSDPLNVKSGTKKVAFVSIKKPSSSSNVDLNSNKTDVKSSNVEDPFFNLLAGGNLRESLLNDD